MTKREAMQALLAGEQPDTVLQRLQGFCSVEKIRQLVPEELHYEGCGEYPEEGAYPFSPMGEERLQKAAEFNDYIDCCTFPVGWGTGAAFGHGGPGEFNKRIIDKQDDRIIVEYETRARKEIRLRPHNVHTFDLPVKKASDLQTLELPDPEAPERYAGLASDVAWAKSHGEWTEAYVNGFFSGAHYFLRDYAEFSVDLVSEPEFAKALIAKVGDWTLAAACKMCEAGVDCIGFCDDLGSEQSLLISPSMYREFFQPWHKKLCDLAHSFGVVVHMHSHGAITPILADIRAAGIDMLNPLDPDEYMPIAEVRELIGPKVVLCGGMDKHFFDWGKDKQLEYLRQLVHNGRRHGPHILMDSGGIPENVDRDWFDWFLLVSKEVRGSRVSVASPLHYAISAARQL